MKNILKLLTLAVLIGLFSCEPRRNYDEDRPKQEETNVTIETYQVHDFLKIHLVQIRDCQYLATKTGTGTSVVHAGDCTNPKHKEDATRGY